MNDPTQYNANALIRLAANAREFGKAFAELREALMREGVRDDIATQEARNAATQAALYDAESGEPCPLCGRGERPL